VSDDRAEEHKRCHAKRHTATRLVNLLDDEVVACFDRLSRQMVEQSDTRSAKRQQEEKPGVIEPCAGREVEAPQESSAKRADRNSHWDQEQRPPQHRYGVVMPVANERSDIQRVIEIPKRSAHDSSLLPCGAR